jgi:hypothetical protein
VRNRFFGFTRGWDFLAPDLLKREWITWIASTRFTLSIAPDAWHTQYLEACMQLWQDREDLSREVERLKGGQQG